MSKMKKRGGMGMKKASAFMMLALLFSFLAISIAHADDIEVRLKTKTGATRFTVKDSDTVEVMGVDSLGRLKLKPAAKPDPAATGEIVVDSGDLNKLKWYDGSVWRSVGSVDADNLTIQYIGNSLEVKNTGIKISKLDITGTPAGGQVLAYDSGTGQLIWQTTSGAVPDGQTIGLNITSGSLEVKDRGITATKIATGAAVTSIASFGATQRLSGEVDVRAGQNIIISQDATSMIISSTGGGGGVTGPATWDSTAGTIVSRDANAGFSAGASTFEVLNVMAGTTDRFEIRSDHVSNIFIGQNAGLNNTPTAWNKGEKNTYIGYLAGSGNSTGGFNTGVGDEVLYQSTGEDNTAVGGWAAMYNTTGSRNTATGAGALWWNNVGVDNSAVGQHALQFTSTSSNTAVGKDAGYSNSTGTLNTYLGYGAGYTGSSSGLTNATAVGANTVVTQSNTVILGNGANVGIGTSEPQAKLHVVGTVKATTFEGDGHLLTNLSGVITNATSESIAGTMVSRDAYKGFKAGMSTFDAVDVTGDYYMDGKPLIMVKGIDHSIYVGIGAGTKETTWSDNTALGYQALANSDSPYNTAIGSGALKMLSGSSAGDVAVGFSALQKLTDNANNNTAIGPSAGALLQNGHSNAFLGHQADAYNWGLTINYSTAIGYNAKIKKDRTVIIGDATDNALQVGIGTMEPQAKLHVEGNIKVTGTIEGASPVKIWGGLNVSGGTITADSFVDASSGYKIGGSTILQFRSNCISLGRNTNTNESGTYITAIGEEALKDNVSTGTSNTAVGAMALKYNTTGDYNTAVGAYSLYKNTEGSKNTALGYYAGYWSTGSYNTFLGANADAKSGHYDVSNSTAIGESAKVSADNTIALGASGVMVAIASSESKSGDTLYVHGSAAKTSGGTSWTVWSDSRLKDVTGNYNYGLAQLMLLEPVRFHYKKDNAVGLDVSEEHIGIIAQEAQKVIPEAISVTSKGYLTFSQDPVFWTMLNAIKEQQVMIQNQQQQIDGLKKAIEQIKMQR